MYICFKPNRHQASPALLIGLPPLPVHPVPQTDRDIGPKGKITRRGARHLVDPEKKVALTDIHTESPQQGKRNGIVVFNRNCAAIRRRYKSPKLRGNIGTGGIQRLAPFKNQLPTCITFSYYKIVLAPAGNTDGKLTCGSKLIPQRTEYL